MGDIRSLEQLTLVAAFVVPGLIALFVRAQFLHGRVEITKDTILVFFALSIIWYGLSAPFVPWLNEHGGAAYLRRSAWFIWIVVGPALFGALLGLNASLGWSRQALERMRVRVVHPLPTAWDWKFSKMASPEWVILVLKDGTQFGGLCGPGSFISSDPKERDIYIERIYRIAEDGEWQPQGNKGLLILHGELRSIEFFPYLLKETTSVE